MKTNFLLDFVKLRSSSNVGISPRSDSSRSDHDTDTSSNYSSYSPRNCKGKSSHQTKHNPRKTRNDSKDDDMPPSLCHDMEVVTKQVCDVTQRDLIAEGIKACNFCPYCREMGVLCAVTVHQSC